MSVSFAERVGPLPPDGDATPSHAGSGRSVRAGIGSSSRAPRPQRPPSTRPSAWPLGRTPEVAADDPWVDAGRKVLRFHLSRMLARVPGTIAGEDPEEVHAMRVAARRIRAGWRVFGDGFERPVVRDHVRQLRRLGTQLGEVRDLDVQIGILVASRDRRSKRERLALTPLLDAWTADRAAQHVELVDLIRSPWFGDFVRDHETLVLTPGAGARPVARNAAATVRMRAPAVDLGGVPGRLGLPARASRGGRRDPPRAADRHQVAALHARIRA